MAKVSIFLERGTTLPEWAEKFLALLESADLPLFEAVYKSRSPGMPWEKVPTEDLEFEGGVYVSRNSAGRLTISWDENFWRETGQKFFETPEEGVEVLNSLFEARKKLLIEEELSRALSTIESLNLTLKEGGEFLKELKKMIKEYRMEAVSFLNS